MLPAGLALSRSVVCAPLRLLWVLRYPAPEQRRRPGHAPILTPGKLQAGRGLHQTTSKMFPVVSRRFGIGGNLIFQINLCFRNRGSRNIHTCLRGRQGCV